MTMRNWDSEPKMLQIQNKEVHRKLGLVPITMEFTIRSVGGNLEANTSGHVPSNVCPMCETFFRNGSQREPMWCKLFEVDGVF